MHALQMPIHSSPQALQPCCFWTATMLVDAAITMKSDIWLTRSDTMYNIYGEDVLILLSN